MRSRVEQVTVTLSALSIGVLGWSVAHGLTWWLLSHQHLVDGVTVSHSHSLLPSVALLAASIAAGALLSMFVVSCRWGQPAGRRTVARRELRRAAALPVVAFLAAELAEHQLTGDHQMPGPMVLLIGGVVYLLAGIATTLLWRGSTQAMRDLAWRLSVLQSGVRTGAYRPPPSIEAAATAVHRRRWTSTVAGRGPPALPV